MGLFPKLIILERPGNTEFIKRIPRYEILFTTRFGIIFKNTKNQCISTFLNNYLPHSYFYTRHSLFNSKKNCTLYRRCFQKHRLFTTFLLVFTRDEVYNISSKYQPPNNLAKYQYFYTRDFIHLFHLEIKSVLSIAKAF